MDMVSREVMMSRLKAFFHASLLLELQANPNANDGSTINEAIRKRQLELLRFLLEKGVSPNVPAADSLAEAIHIGRSDLVLLLLDHGADITLNNFNALRLAMAWSKRDLLRVLFERVALLMQGNQNIMEPLTKTYADLCISVMNNDTEKVVRILGTGFYAGLADFEDFYLPCLVYRIRGREVSKAFIHAGVGVKEIYLAAIAEYDAELQKLCLERTNFDPRTMKFDSDALFLACRFNRLKIILLLVANFGLDLESCNEKGETPLYFITEPNVLRILLSTFSEVDPNAISTDGYTLLQSNQYNCESYSVLLEHGVDPRFCKRDNRHIKTKCNYNLNCPVVQHMQKILLIDLDYVNALISGVLLNVEVRSLEKLECPKLRKEFLHEVLKMQSIQICQSISEVKRQSLLDLIFLNPNEITSYARSEELVKMYNESDQDFQNYFPHYGFALNHQLRRGQVRCDRLDSALKLLCSAMGCDLPKIFAERIFGFFSNRYLDRYNLALADN